MKDNRKFFDTSPLERWDLFHLPWLWEGLWLFDSGVHSGSDAMPVLGLAFEEDS